MLQGWHTGTRVLEVLQVNISEDYTRMKAVALSQDLTPRRHDETVAKRPAAALMLAGLRRRKDEALCLDCACTQQRMPMGLPGRHRKRGGHREEACAPLGQRTIEVRKANVVADRHSEHAPGQPGENGL